MRRIVRPGTLSQRPETHTARRARSLTQVAHTLWGMIHKLRAHTLSLGAHTHTSATHTLRPGSHRANMYPQIIAAHTLRVLNHMLPGWWRRMSTPHQASTSGVMSLYQPLPLILTRLTSINLLNTPWVCYEFIVKIPWHVLQCKVVNEFSLQQPLPIPLITVQSVARLRL